MLKMNKPIEVLMRQLHGNKNNIAELHGYTKAHQEHIANNDIEIKVLEDANKELETAISMLKSRSC